MTQQEQILSAKILDDSAQNNELNWCNPPEVNPEENHEESWDDFDMDSVKDITEVLSDNWQESNNLLKNIFREEARFIPLNEKFPLTKKWQEKQFTLSDCVKRLIIKHTYTKTDKETKKEIEYQTRSTGIGIVTGNGYIAFDFDGHNAFKLAEELAPFLLELKTLSWTSGTEGRKQILCKIPDSYLEKFKGKTVTELKETESITAINIKDNKWEQLELRYEREQSVLPSSKHPDTKEYIWLDKTPPVELTNEQCDRILSLFNETKTKTVTDKKGKTHKKDSIKGRYAQLTLLEQKEAENNLIRLLKELEYSHLLNNPLHYQSVLESYTVLSLAVEGERNDILNDVGLDLGQLINEKGLDDKETYIKETYGKTPFNECQSQIRKILLYTCKTIDYDDTRGINSTLISSWEGAKNKPRSDREQKPEDNLTKLIKEYKDYTLANNLLKEITTRLEKTLYYSSTSGCWYYYTDRKHYFGVVTEEMVLSLIDNIYTQKSEEWCHLKNYNPSNHQVTASKLKDLIYLTKTKLTLSYDQEQERENQRLALCKTFLPLKNGILNLETKELLPHHPQYMNTYVLDYDYEPLATSPKTLNFLTSAVSNEGDFKILMACIRAMLLSRYDLQFFLEVIGQKGSGKGTFVRLIQDLIGQTNCYTTTLEELESDDYSFADFHHKKLVSISEGTQYNKRANKLLSITGGDSLNVRQKHKQSGGSKKFEGCVLVNGNERIRASDRTNALERRRRHIDFNNVPTKPNPRLNEELKSEINGFLNYILEMSNDEMEDIVKYPNLYSQGYSERMIEDKLNEDPLTNYVNEYLIITPDQGVSTEEIWVHYTQTLNRLQVYSSKIKDPYRLGNAIREILRDNKIDFKDSNKIKVEGKYKRGIKGIILRDGNDYDTPYLLTN